MQKGGVMMDGYYYLHTYGSLIWKSAIVTQNAPDYFDSPFVKKLWKVNLSNREDCWRVVLEALALNCPLPRIKQLANKWNLTYKDSLQLLKRTKPSLEMKEGLSIFVKEILHMEVDEYWKKVEKDWV